MTREEYNAIIKKDRSARMQGNVSGNTVQTSNAIPNYNISKKEVGAELYNSAPINVVEPKKLVQDNISKIDTWLEPSYKLSNDEAKEAKEYIKNWRKENNAFKNNPYKTQEGTRELQKVAELESKLSKGTAAWSGFMNSFPFLNNIQNKVANAFGDENTKDVIDEQRQSLEASKMQNPGAAFAGNAAGQIAKYNAANALMTGAGILGESGRLTKGVSKVIKNPKVAGSVANIVGDTALDVALDTIPHLAEDIAEGDEKAGANALKNVGTNLAFNTLGEGVGIVGGKVLGKLADNKKALGKANSLNPLEDSVKKADEVVEGASDLKDALKEIPNETAETVAKNNPVVDAEVKPSVAEEITDYKKFKIPNHDDMNKNIDKFVGMYGDDAAKAKALEFKKSINRVIEENSEEAWEELINNTTELDAMLKGKTYTFKRQKSGKNKSNIQQATYNNEIRDIFRYETDSIAKEASENALKNGTVSKSRTNTLESSGINTADELKNKYLNEENFKYQEISEKQSMEEATTRVSLNPEHWKNKLMSQDSLSGADVDTMMLIYTDVVQKARQTGDDELWKEAGSIFKKIQEAGTKGGQLVQSFAKWSRNTPEGIVADSFRKAKEQASSVIGDKKAKELIDTLYEDTQKEIYALANVAYSSGIGSRNAQIAFAKIGKIINANTPKTVSGAVKTYLMDSMLLNFRTLISRNMGGNLGYNAMEFVRQPITSAIDKGVSKFTGKRTRTGWNADKINSALEGLAKGIADEVDDIKKGVHTGKSGDNAIKSAVYLNAHALKGTNPVSSALNKIDDLTKHMISFGDRPFYEAAYKQRMSELTELRSKGLLGADIGKMSDADFNQFAELSAKMDGLTATYQDKGDMAKAFTDLKNAIGQYSKGVVGFDALSQLAMPFTNTPGNIITRSLEYSPFGVVKNAANTVNEVRKGDFNQQRFVDELGRNVLGTGLFAGGIAAYDKGLMTGSYSDDKDMKNAQKNSGMQEYALQGNDGEWNFDISWIPVLGNNMIMAAAAKEAFDEGESNADAINKAASASANALLNTSTLQGLNRVFGGNTSYSTENNLFENAKDALTSGFGQAIPSVIRQVAQSTDEYERNLSEGDRPYWQNSMINSIPGLRESMLQPKIDNEGNYVMQNQGRDLGSRILENMVSPGKFTEISDSNINKEAMRLFESTGNKYAFVPTASRSDITKGEYEPNDAQYRRYQQTLGKYNSDLVGELIDSDFYKSLSDESKEKVLQSAYSGMKAAAKMELMPGYTSDDKIAEAFKIGGVKGAMAYIERKIDFDNAGASMSSKNAMSAYMRGGKEALNDYAEYNKAVDSLGLSVNDKTQSLYNEGGIPYLKQYSAYKSGADADGNGSLKKKEVTSYLDSTNLSRAEKRYWFSVLSTAKNPY